MEIVRETNNHTMQEYPRVLDYLKDQTNSTRRMPYDRAMGLCSRERRTCVLGRPARWAALVYIGNAAGHCQATIGQ